MMKKILAALMGCFICCAAFAQYFSYPELPTKAKKIRQFILPGWSILDSAHGDLNGDRMEDVAFTIQYKDTATELRPDNIPNQAHPRILVILLKDPKRPRYTLALQHNTFILREGEGGMVNDPHTDLKIDSGRLKLELQFTRSSALYEITFRENDFYLVRAETFNVAQNNYEHRKYDFLKRKAMVETGKIDNDKEKNSKAIDIPEGKLKKLRELLMPFMLEVLAMEYI